MNATLLRVFVAIFTVAVGTVWAQESKLPPCASLQKILLGGDCSGTSVYDGGRYVGEFRDKKRHGYGTETRDNGQKYVGEWKDDSPNGLGTATLPNGEQYIGEFKNWMYDGQGSTIFPSGTKQEGEFRNNKLSGFGTHTEPTGLKYVGEWRDGRPEGNGTMFYPSGDRYVGEWRGWKPDGRGTYTWSDGRYFVGIWKEDLRNGPGMLFKPNGIIESSGTYLKDKLVNAHWVDPTLLGLPANVSLKPNPLLPESTASSELQSPTIPSIGALCPKQVVPAIPDRAMREGVSGIVRAQIKIVENQVSDVVIFSGPKVFHEEVIKAVRQYKCFIDKSEVIVTQEFIFKIPPKLIATGSDDRNSASPDTQLQTPQQNPLTAESEEKRQSLARMREQERLGASELEGERKRREEAEERLRIAQQQQRPVAPIQQSLNVHALVIGNAAYPGSGRLDNPVNDSRAITAKLRSFGFKVTEVEDATRAKLVTALGQFSRSAASADLSVLFYSGHGVQLFGTNYILPTDIDQSDLAQATIQGISLDSVIGQFLPGKTKLVFLDACRDNPLYQASANKSFSKGLAPISVAEGILIAYATKDGQVASDGGKGTKNSPFTTALLEHLSDPDDIAVVLRRVREKVKIATGGKQVPWDYGSLTGGALVLSAIKPTGSKK